MKNRIKRKRDWKKNKRRRKKLQDDAG